MTTYPPEVEELMTKPPEQCSLADFQARSAWRTAEIDRLNADTARLNESTRGHLAKGESALSGLRETLADMRQLVKGMEPSALDAEKACAAIDAWNRSVQRRIILALVLSAASLALSIWKLF